MKKRSLKYLFLIISLVSLGTFLTMFSNATLSWFMTKDQVSFNDEAFGKGLANYFESGDGSEESPYVISNSTHFYNFAWLQYLGQFNKDEDGDGNIDQKYFKLKNDINMKGFILPPVGTEENPFVGNFNGQNYIINNLTVSNSYDDLKTSRHPSTVNASNYVQMNVVGTFGIIGQYNTTLSYTSSINTVSNFYLENVSILTDSTNLLVGIFAGYANGVISNCGVHSSNVKVKSGTSYITDSTLSKYNDSKVSKYTLLGAYNSNDYKREDQEGSGDAGYGTSIDIRSLYDKLSTNSSFIEGTTMVFPKGYAVPIKFDNDSDIIPGSGTKTVTSSNTSITASYASTLSTSSSATNIGYYSGGEVKVYKSQYSSSTLNFDDMRAAGNTSINPFYNPTDELKAHINKIKEHLNSDDGSGGRNGDHAITLSGTYFDTGSGYTNFPTSKDNYLVVKNGKVGSTVGDIFIPARGIWVAPVTPGTFEFVAVNSTSSNAVIAIFRLKRATPKDYSTGFTNLKYRQESDFTNDMCGAIIYGGGKPCYYGIKVTQEDIDAGYEFFITKYAIGANPYIVYIDIGTDGSSDSDTRTALTNIDYVTTDSSNTIIKMDYSSYTKSNVSFTISPGLDNTYTYYFKRNSDGVYYYVIDNGYNYITSNGTGTSVKSKDENCDEQA